MSSEFGFETNAIHAGQEPDPTTGAVVPPIYQVSTYKQDSVGGARGGHDYARSINPTRTALEECLAALENGHRGFAFASGMAAIDTVFRTVLKPGDHVVMPNRYWELPTLGLSQRSPTSTASWWASTTPLRRPIYNNPCNSERTLSCTQQRST